MNWIVGLLVVVVSMEVPDIRHERRTEHLASIKEMADINYAVTREHTALVNPDVDMALLSAVQYFESRYKTKPKDGDCVMRPTKTEMKQVCSAIGPMQINKQTAVWLLRWKTEITWATVNDGKRVTAEQLRDPVWNVRAGLEVIRHWKAVCGGPPGVWLTAYGWGRCPAKGYVDREGARRCALATALLERAGNTPDGWKCGHEGRLLGSRDLKLISHVANAAL